MLTDIGFASYETYILSFEPEPRILVKWSLRPTSQNLKNLFFAIWRGEQPEDLELIADRIPHDALLEYVDYTGKLKNTEKLYYYRIIATEYDGTHVTPLQTFKTEPFHWEGALDLVGLYIIDEHLFAFREVYGMPALIYKKHSEGARCPECWDTVLKRVTKSNCHSCFGTGFLKGYYAPIEAWMDFNPDPKVSSVAEFGLKQSSQTDALFTNYPQLKGGDIVIEVQSNRYWRVSNVRNTEKNRTTILQVLRLDEINRSDIELHLPVDQDLRMRLLKHLAIRESYAEF